MKSEGILLNLLLPRTKGACLAHFRTLLELTQTDISNEIGINRSSISKMENGDINVSEHVWFHVLKLVYYGLEFEQYISFIEFRHSLEIFIKEDEGRLLEWSEKKLSWQQGTSI
ncbi:hypothetical protein BKP35_16560 [Anaerobacillus arseniciselenatis]|uniref:HTH cro/C1-type domain-containing protein n=1 Tax=Anaerobacillus arseniciselenatis TaxID=85682 RepID=A0A1S2LAU8_9BACI|nr:helix-turn-helix transcriptional regulator [Anaerobacillus arseniciselenatis]OIJ09466.1 hypothetical protein BKP35_16560 [Anaerobacillus arseniciselenatis]